MNILNASSAKPLRGGPSFSTVNRAERMIWNITWVLLARWTPPNFSRWRLMLLRMFGANIKSGAAISNSAKIWLPRNLTMQKFATIGPRVNCYNMDLVEVGEFTTISQGAVLCGGTHDISDPDFQLVARSIKIGDHVWIAAEAFVGPGVSVGNGAVLGARSCAFRDLEPWTVYGGNPAKPLKLRKWRVKD